MPHGRPCNLSLLDGQETPRLDSGEPARKGNPEWSRVAQRKSAVDDEWPHHVMLFVFEDVTVPYVLVAARPRTWRYGERNLGQSKLHDYPCHLARIHADCLLPPAIVRVGR